MSTVQTVVDRFRRRYPTCEEDHALELFNDVHRELCSRSQLRNVVASIPLVQGVAEYDMPAEVMSIHEAYYEPSSDPSSWISLVERSLDEYVVKRRGWRSDSPSAEPQEYYVTSASSGNSSIGQIGIWPTSSLTSEDGYPRLRLYVTSCASLTLDDTVSPQILNDSVYLYGMWAKWEAERQDGNLSYLQAYQILFDRELEKTVQFVKNVQENSSTQLAPAYIGQQTPVL